MWMRRPLLRANRIVFMSSTTTQKADAFPTLRFVYRKDIEHYYDVCH
jgi:hypothetical protein